MNSMSMLLIIAIVAAMFALRVYLVQFTFNCARSAFAGGNIDFQTAMCLTILCSLLFATGSVIVQQQR